MSLLELLGYVLHDVGVGRLDEEVRDLQDLELLVQRALRDTLEVGLNEHGIVRLLDELQDVKLLERERVGVVQGVRGCELLLPIEEGIEKAF
jgi:hypothetical protein